MRRLIWILGLGACTETIPAPPDDGNTPPSVLTVHAGCESQDGVPMWRFTAEVDDPDGLSDVLAVHAYVIDEDFDVEVTDLPLSEQEPGRWETRFDAVDSPLNCTYSNYSVDFIATDSAGEIDELTVWPEPALGI